MSLQKTEKKNFDKLNNENRMKVAGRSSLSVKWQGKIHSQTSVLRGNGKCTKDGPTLCTALARNTK